jgi:hypothetical protein
MPPKPEQGTETRAIFEYSTDIPVILMKAAKNYLPSIR